MMVSASSVLIQAINLGVDYPVSSGHGRTRKTFAAVRNVDLSVRRGEVTGIVGESGSGKSTLARALAGLQMPTRGSVLVAGNDTQTLPARARRDLRKTVQFVFQDPYSSLNPRMTVRRTIERALVLHSGRTSSERLSEVRRLLEAVGLPASAEGRYPRELSGGQRQRVAIARALACEPDAIVADEPTASLDVSVQAQILTLLSRLVRERNLTLLMVTHDFAAVSSIAERVIVMHLGQIVEDGDMVDVIHEPMHPYSQVLLSAVPSDACPTDQRLRPKAGPVSPQSHIDGCLFHTRCPFSRTKCESTPQRLEAANGRRVRCEWVSADVGRRWRGQGSE